MELGVIILAGGEGQRMKSDIPKVCHTIGGQPILQYVVQACQNLPPHTLCVVVSPSLERHAAFAGHPFLNKLKTVQQIKPRGTADAVVRGLAALPRSVTHVIILCGDVPTVSETLLKEMSQHASCDAVWAGFELGADEKHIPYGRIVMQGSKPLRIVEWADATPKERDITLANSGIYLFSRALLEHGLVQRMNENSNGKEWYLTDLMEWADKAGYSMKLLHTDHASAHGVNTRADLSKAHEVLQQRWRQRHMDAGVTLINADQITFAIDTELGIDSHVEGPVWFGPGVKAAKHVKILPFSVLEQCTLHDSTVVGPFARLRGKVVMENHSQVGNFVEIKGSHIGEHAKIKHLSYVGDTTMGRHVNIGAGMITANYDGQNKHPTIIEEGAHIGANVSLIAPVKIGAYSVIGAGSVITQPVDPHTLALERNEQVSKPRKNKK